MGVVRVYQPCSFPVLGGRALENSVSIINGLTWLGGGVIALLSVIGGGSLILAVLNRIWTKGDKKKEIVDSTKSEQIKGDTTITQQVMEWMKEVEKDLRKDISELRTELKEMEKDLDSQREMNVRKDEKIKHLEEENDRLRKRTNDQDKEISSLRTEIDNLKELIRQFHGNKPQLVSSK
jgi:predicted RNase H-like nuclease (RuvC/YqgF family)